MPDAELTPRAAPTAGNKPAIPLLMGIMNLTPDSFSDGGALGSDADIRRRAQELVTAGADILDLGAESTRPGAEPVDPEQEQQRLLPALEAVLDLPPAPGVKQLLISVDTRHPDTAEAALDYASSRGCSVIINDVSGLQTHPRMPAVVAAYGAEIVITHNRADPQSMTAHTHYLDLLAEVQTELEDIRQRYLKAGVAAERIILDPGIGFSKTHEQNWELIQSLPQLVDSGHRLLFGASRKAFLGTAIAQHAGAAPLPPQQRDTATAVLSGVAALAGVWAVRVHEIPGNRQAMIVALKTRR